MSERKRRINDWVISHYLQLALFNIFLILIFLLRSAGYFHPFMVISVNLIVVFSLILAVVLFGWGGRHLYFVAVVFWVFALFLKLVKIDIWAERTTIYVYQSLVIGTVLLMVEGLFSRIFKKG